MSLLEEFATSLQGRDRVARLRAGLIGENAVIDGPFGKKPLVYADYVASGRALEQVEDFVRENILPFYANTHTQASFCGSYMSKLREAARAEVARLTGAGSETSVIFTGAGSTSGINSLVGLLDIAKRSAAGERVVVLTGPYEHHSNILPWRESGAEVIEIPEGPAGGPDVNLLAAALKAHQNATLLIGTFSAASNVTGILTDEEEVSRLLKRYGALSVWDFGCAGPYRRMNMDAGSDAAKDAVVFSTHKFPGGPGASGVLVLRDAIACRTSPTRPGGGTVSFVSPWSHQYVSSISEREESGTPNVIGDIRVALAMLVKEALGQHWLDARQEALRLRARQRWSENPYIELLGLSDAAALPIFSFRVRDGRGGFVHHQFFTRLLSDLYGVQARGGCACAGPYGHRLLGLDQAASDAIVEAIASGEETAKPGWVRLNFSALMTDEKADLIIEAVDKLARSAADYEQIYHVDRATARFTAA